MPKSDQNQTTKPVAYVVGQTNFMGLLIEVTPAVLIPRPETEFLVERALKIIESQKNPVVIDVGTGSGAIACAIKYFRSDALVCATDISRAALEVAKKNSKRLKLDIEFLEGNLLETYAGKVDLVIANLPYLDKDEVQLPELDWEPSAALYAGDSGFSCIRELLATVRPKLFPHGTVLLEVHPPLEKKLKEYFESHPEWEWKIETDFNNLVRYVRAVIV